MKKTIIGAITAAMMCITALQVCAADRAYRIKKQVLLDYTPIESYVIDEEIYIPAEELAYYGFDVDYDAENRAVNISRNKFAYPVYTKQRWESACRKQTYADIYKSGITVYLDGQAVDSFSIGGWELIRIDELKKYGTISSNNYDDINIEIYKREIVNEVENAENKQEVTYTDKWRHENHYVGQVNAENEPDGWGSCEIKYGYSKTTYIGHFSNGNPDGVIHKQTYKTVSRSYTHRYTNFIGEVDGSREAKREYITYEGQLRVDLVRGENFRCFITPFLQIPEWTGPETPPDTTVYLKGCYYEVSYGQYGTNAYRIWYDNGDNAVMQYVRSKYATFPNHFGEIMKKNPKIYKADSFYEYENDKEIFYNTFMCTMTGDGTEDSPIVLNDPNDGAEQYPLHITIELNGEILTFGWSEKVFVKNGCTFVPLREISEAMGAEVSWEGDTQTVKLEKDGKTILFKIGDNVMIADDSEIFIDEAPQLIFDSTFIPVRIICDAFGASVEWNDNIKRVIITSG